MSRQRRARGDPGKGSRRFLGIIVKETERADWQIYDDLKEFQTAKPRPWRWPGAVSRFHRRLYAQKRSAQRKLYSKLGFPSVPESKTELS